MIYLQLFLSYLKIGFFGFGGGYAMLSLIQNEIVINHNWITMDEFTDIVALSQMTPGPIAINSATYVGYHIAGFWGAAIATLSVCLPAMTIMLLIAKFYLKLKNSPIVTQTIRIMSPVIVGMILSAVLLMIFPYSASGESFIDLWSWILFISACYISYKKILGPIQLILVSALIGMLIYA